MFTLMAIAMVTLLQPRATVADLTWMSGCWELTREARHVIEQWTSPEGGTIVGLSRTVVRGRTREYEFMLIREGPGGLEYVAKPSGQAEGTFTSVSVSGEEVVFENPQHDFPTRIIYKRDGNGGLLAAIEGERNGQPQRIEYPYKAATCGR